MAIGDSIKEWWDNLYVGDGTVNAMGRLGLAELRNAVSLGPESAEGMTPYGMYGNITPVEVGDTRASNDEAPAQTEAPMTMDQLREYAAQRAAEAEQQMERTPGREM